MAPRTLKAGEKANVALIGYGIQQRQALLPQFANQYRRGAQIVGALIAGIIDGVGGDGE
jgi:hypothetical protein